MSSVHESDPIVGGFVSFTEVLDGEHHSYNAWHMFDHMPEQFPIPGIAHGQRWVLTPGCAEQANRREPPFDSVHYFTLYLMTEPLRETVREFYRVGERLRDADRFHEQRRSHLAGLLAVTGTWAADRVLVSPAAVPYRPCRGLFLVVERHDEPTTNETVGGIAPALLVHRGVAGIWTFATRPEVGRPAHAEGNYRIAVAYCDEDPVAVAGRSGDQLTAGLASPGAQLLLATPVESIHPRRWDWFD